MRKHLIFTLFICSMLLSGCALHGATYRVRDAQTKEPVEGAVAIAWYDKAKGLPGLTYHVTAKVLEWETGPDGVFKIPAGMTSHKPRIKVYKPGYVGWDNWFVYLGCWENDRKRVRYKKREGFKYKSQDIYLEHWKDEYSRSSHMNFLMRHIPLDYDYERKYREVVRKYELPLKRQENVKIHKRKTK